MSQTMFQMSDPYSIEKKQLSDWTESNSQVHCLNHAVVDVPVIPLGPTSVETKIPIGSLEMTCPHKPG